MRRGVMRAFGKSREFRRHRDEGGREGEFGPKLVQFLKVEVDGLRALRPQRGLQKLGGYVRVPVAIAANPAAHLKKRWQRDQAVRWLKLRELVLEVAVKQRELTQKRMVVVAEVIIDLVDD